MKAIYRSLNKGLFLAALIALGAVASLAQDPCTDADGQTKWRDNFTAIFATKTADGYKVRIETAKSGLEKYGKCESFADMTKYINDNIAKWEETKKGLDDGVMIKAMTDRFDKALTSKNLDETFAAGKDLLQNNAEKFRPVEITLAAIGGEEALKANSKYNDDTLRFAKQSIADLEAGKSFKVGDKERYGLGAGEFPNKEDALAWLNLYSGYITSAGKKDKAGSLPYLYKASQATASETSKNSVIYDLIGSYYFDELGKVVEEIKKMVADQKDTDTPEVAQQKVDAIKAKVALSNGIAERAMDAYSRAFTFAKDATIKARLKKNVEGAYQLRFGNTTGVDTWIAGAVAKPFVNPTTPVAPISDPEPVKTTSGVGSGVGAANGTGMGAANGTGVGAANGSGIGGVTASNTIVNTTPVKSTTGAAAKPKAAATTPAAKKP